MQQQCRWSHPHSKVDLWLVVLSRLLFLQCCSFMSSPTVKQCCSFALLLRACCSLCVYVLCLMSWGPTGGQQTEFCSSKFVHSKNSTPKRKTAPNKSTTCIGFSFGQEVCYCTTLLEKTCASDLKRSISRAIKEEMLLILSLQRIAHQTYYDSLSPRSRCTFPSHRPVSTRRPWQPFLNLLSNLLLDQHFMADKYAACH